MHSPRMPENFSSEIGRLRTRAESPLVQPPLSTPPEQVAAVCYRVRGAAIEFLLVRTRKGRWTFPKGRAETGLTRSQAAALEAFEEAGVQGRVEASSFARYRRGKLPPLSASAQTVRAYLCEVLRLVPPQEPNRNRTWFSPGQAKGRLRENRSPDNGSGLARVVDSAVIRIQRLHSIAGTAAEQFLDSDATP